MRISTKTSLALHLLVLLAVFHNQKMTSELLAKSIGCNPVMVRNLLGSLKKAGMVMVQRGTGGAGLVVSPKGITVWKVYEAVDTTPLDTLIGVHLNPSMQCPVGNNINTLLEKPYALITGAVKAAMESYTLAQLLENYQKLEQSPESMFQINIAKEGDG